MAAMAKRDSEVVRPMTLGASVAVGVVGVLASASLAQAVELGAGAASAPEAAGVAGATPAPAAAPAVEAPASARVEAPQVVGTFSFAQGVVTPTDQIARTLGGADKVLCSGGEASATSGEAPAADAATWELSIGGNGVSSSFTATLGELAQDGAQTRILGCSCAGNPADGRATANAACTGVTVASLLDLAGVVEGANTITFTSADGYEVALPLSYVEQRASMIVYQVNGEPLANSMGGTNQLWLGSTAARHFARDIVAISVTCEDEDAVPPAPGTPAAGEAAGNLPNVSVESATAA